jgi:hypothetical protein
LRVANTTRAMTGRRLMEKILVRMDFIIRRKRVPEILWRWTAERQSS